MLAWYCCSACFVKHTESIAGTLVTLAWLVCHLQGRLRSRSQISAHLPQFREKLHIEHMLEVGDSSGTARTAFEADNSLNGCYVAEAPLPERVFKVNQFFGQFV